MPLISETELVSFRQMANTNVAPVYCGVLFNTHRMVVGGPEVDVQTIVISRKLPTNQTLISPLGRHPAQY